MVTLNMNGIRREVNAPDDTPLLYVLRNDLELIGPQFGCGLAQCGACAVLVEGKEARSCITPVSGVAGQEITALEGLHARWAKQKGLSAEEAKNTLHPAWSRLRSGKRSRRPMQSPVVRSGLIGKACPATKSSINI